MSRIGPEILGHGVRRAGCFAHPPELRATVIVALNVTNGGAGPDTVELPYHLPMRFRLVDATRRVQARLQLGASGWLAYLLGATALAGSLAVFADATEDVRQHNGLTVRDAANLGIVVRHRSDVLVQVSKIVTNFGGAGVVVAVAAIAGIVLWRRGLGLVLALAPGLAAGLAVAVVAIVKAIVGRARPPVGLHLVSEHDASFPSGHATDSTAVLLTDARSCSRCSCFDGRSPACWWSRRPD